MSVQLTLKFPITSRPYGDLEHAVKGFGLAAFYLRFHGDAKSQ